jgi:alanine dehydrogenase
MKVGIPKELKDNEYRVAITPAGVRELVVHGHDVIIERTAGLGSSITDAEFERAGGSIVADADTVFAEAELVLKVKEPVEEEFARLRKDLILFTFLHLAATESVTRALMESGTTAVA